MIRPRRLRLARLTSRHPGSLALLLCLAWRSGARLKLDVSAGMLDSAHGQVRQAPYYV